MVIGQSSSKAEGGTQYLLTFIITIITNIVNFTITKTTIILITIIIIIIIMIIILNIIIMITIIMIIMEVSIAIQSDGHHEGEARGRRLEPKDLRSNCDDASDPSANSIIAIHPCKL